MPAWIVIAIVTIFIGSASSFLIKPDEFRWFKSLRRPRWLTFEWAIPFIWSFIFICGAISAYLVWQKDPGSPKTWLLMAIYILLEIVTVAYTTILVKLRSLRAGTLIGGTGGLICLVLTLAVFFSVSDWAALLLVPYLLWSPIGTYTTWIMIRLNPRTEQPD